MSLQVMSTKIERTNLGAMPYIVIAVASPLKPGDTIKHVETIDGRMVQAVAWIECVSNAWRVIDGTLCTFAYLRDVTYKSVKKGA